MLNVSIDQVFKELRFKCTGPVLENEPLFRHTTLQVGGPARIYATADTLNDLRFLLQTAYSFDLPHFVIGKGSNLLVSDKGFDGIVIQLGRDFQKVKVEGTSIQAGASVGLPLLIQLSYREGLEGLAFALGIPGTLGGALATNAGAHGFSLGEVVKSVTLYSHECELKSCDRSEIDFGYRSANFPIKGLIVEAVLELKRGDPYCIRLEMDKYFKRRKATQPLKYPNAGSIFKNPPGISAGKVIEELGWKGVRVGEAQVSSEHANFIVNLGNANAQQVCTLIKSIQRSVYQKRGLVLETEVNLLGEFEECPPLTRKDVSAKRK